MIKVTKTQLAQAIYVTECEGSMRGEVEVPYEKLYWEQKLKYRCAADRFVKVCKLLEKGEYMPVECDLLKGKPYAKEICPKCNIEFPEFMRGLVQSKIRKFFRLPYCAVICHGCKEIIGWEKP